MRLWESALQNVSVRDLRRLKVSRRHMMSVFAEVQGSVCTQQPSAQNFIKGGSKFLIKKVWYWLIRGAKFTYRLLPLGVTTDSAGHIRCGADSSSVQFVWTAMNAAVDADQNNRTQTLLSDLLFKEVMVQLFWSKSVRFVCAMDVIQPKCSEHCTFLV